MASPNGFPFDRMNDHAGPLQSSPVVFGLAGKHEDHGERCHATAATFRAPMTKPHTGEREPDRIGRAKMRPMLGGKIIEGRQHVAVFFQHSTAFGSFTQY